jgi:hypothetical protein
VVVDDANRGFESQLQGPAGDGEGIFRMGNAAADNRIDIDIEFRELRQPLQLPEIGRASCRERVLLGV